MSFSDIYDFSQGMDSIVKLNTTCKQKTNYFVYHIVRNGNQIW